MKHYKYRHYMKMNGLFYAPSEFNSQYTLNSRLGAPQSSLNMVMKAGNIAPNGNRIPVVQFVASHCLSCSGSQSYF
jgi:hypothetical protein